MYLSQGYVLQDGRFISQHHQRIAELIANYDPTLSLVWIPDTERITEEDKKYPFGILCTPTNGNPPYMVFKIPEDRVDQRLLTELWAWDATRHNISDTIDMQYISERGNIAKKAQEIRDHNRAMGLDILNSPKHNYKHNGVRYD
jgi:hypothetical protein